MSMSLDPLLPEHSASDIVVGVLKSLQKAGPRLDVTIDGSLLAVQPWRVTMEVERAIEGNLAPGEITFHTFLNDYRVQNRGYKIGPNFLTFEEGQRRIVFLTRENGLLRTTFDVYGPDLAVYSGSAAPVRFESADSLGDRIARILFTVRPGAHVAAMASHLEQEYAYLMVSAYPKTAFGLLRGLAEQPDVTLHQKACMVLVGWHAGQDACLHDLLVSGNDLLEQEARRFIERDKQNEAALIGGLRRDPFHVSPIPPNATVKYAKGVFEIFAQHPNEGVRSASCHLLLSLWSSETFPDCGHGNNAKPVSSRRIGSPRL